MMAQGSQCVSCVGTAGGCLLGTLGGIRLERMEVLVVSVLLERGGVGGSERFVGGGAAGAGCFLGTL